MKKLTPEEKQLQKDAKKRRAYDRAQAIEAENEHKEYLKSLSFGERLELKAGDDKANWFERWLYDTFFDSECMQPKHQRSTYVDKQVETQKVVFYQRVRRIAIQNDVDEEAVILHYFRKLGEYVNLKNMHVANQSDVSTLKRELEEVFSDMLVDALLQVGVPYWLERGWVMGLRVTSAEQYHYEIERRKNTPSHNFGQAPYLAYDCTSFLVRAGFKFH